MALGFTWWKTLHFSSPPWSASGLPPSSYKQNHSGVCDVYIYLDFLLNQTMVSPNLQ